MLNKKGELRKLLDDQESGCITFFIAFLIAGAATLIWRTKVAFFILAVTIIFFILLLMELCLVCCSCTYLWIE